MAQQGGGPPAEVEGVRVVTTADPLAPTRAEIEGGRRLPGTTSICQLCKARVVWARTVASETNRGGVNQAFDPIEHPDGNVAIVDRGNGRLLARALHKGETHDRTVEYLGMPHAATCKAPPKEPLPANVVDLAAARARKARR